MSIARATTQLIKSRTILAVKLAAVKSEQDIMIDTIKKKYEGRKADLDGKFAEAHGALKALGLSDSEIDELSAKFAQENNITLPEQTDSTENA